MPHKHLPTILLLALLAGTLALPSQAQTRLRAGDSPTSDSYRSSFAVFGAGGANATAAAYQVKDRVTYFERAEARQESSIYEVVDLLTANRLGANNGLASGQGTIMTISWSQDKCPPTAKGFEIRRSATGNIDSYVKINDATIATNTYEDKGLSVGTYFYIVYLVDEQDKTTQWTQPFFGTISADSDAKAWMLY